MMTRMVRWFGPPSTLGRGPRSLRLLPLEGRVTPDASPRGIAVSNFYQNWNDNTLITANDNWSGVPSVVGFLGDDTIGEGVDPQTVLTPYATVDVIANAALPLLPDGGVAEFDGLGTVALQGDATADAPNLVVFLNTTGRANISISYNLRDMDGTADNAIQPVALQYRIGNAGNFVNVPSGFVADATTGPSLADKVTPVSVTLPSAVDNQSLVQVRIITTNAVGNDEWVGVDDIVVGSKEFNLNSFVGGQQRARGDRNVAVDADGDALVVWESYSQDGSKYGVYGQRFNSAGAKIGVEFQINTYTTNDQSFPSVAVDADGDAVVVWASYLQDGSFHGVYGQRFNSAGKVGGEFQINTNTVGTQRFPSVAMDADGDAVVVWQSNQGSTYGVYGQQFNSSGTKVGSEFQINTFTTGNQLETSVAVDADGDVLVVWTSAFQDGNASGIFGQRFNLAGKVGGEFPINTYTTNSQFSPSVAADADGDALVVWSSNGQDGSSPGIYGQRFNSAGAKVGSEFQINTYTTGNQDSPSVAVDADGDALVVWQSYGQDSSASGVYGQRFNSAGAKAGGELQINTYTTFHQRSPSAAMDADGDTVVAWEDNGQEGGSHNVYGQRFQSPNPAAKVSNIQVNDGSMQRSMVTSLKITFDEPVSFVGSPAAAFFLARQLGFNAFLSAVVDGSGTVVTLTFPGGTVDLGGSLSDGRYTLTIIGNQFTGNGFDGNGDGIPGDNYVLVGDPGAAPKLFRLFGDADGDGDVDAVDFGAFRGAFGGSANLAFDFDGDGDVDAVDFGQFRSRFGVSV